jgi:DNA-binding transcriptional ArsR family regulator
VGEIAGHFRCSRPAVSKHLRVLRLAALVRAERRGPRRGSLDALRLGDAGGPTKHRGWPDVLTGLRPYAESAAVPV